MGKLDIYENKSLKIKNVISKEFKDIRITDIDHCILKFIRQIELSKIETIGPIITIQSGTKIKDEEISTDYRVMVQSKRLVVLPKFDSKESIIFNNCLYLRFKGRKEDINYVFSKFDIYIYENNYIDKGEIITIFVDDDIIDFFKPVELNNYEIL